MNKENYNERLSLIKEKIDYLIIMNIEFKNYKNIVDSLEKDIEKKYKEIIDTYTSPLLELMIDNLYKNSNKVGLIKLDTEGFETLIIEGSIEIIKRDKPILVIAIYHTPQDFFELKDKIKNLNMGYKFLIRRSEMVLPQADLVLIAY